MTKKTREIEGQKVYAEWKTRLNEGLEELDGREDERERGSDGAERGEHREGSGGCGEGSKLDYRRLIPVILFSLSTTRCQSDAK